MTMAIQGLRWAHPGPLVHKPLYGTHTTGKFGCLAMANVSTTAQSCVQRRSANYQPSLWTYDFVKSINNHHTDETNKERAERLAEEVRAMIGDSKASPSAVVELIEDVQRLGLGYHFEEDIRKALERLMSLQASNGGMEETSLHATALRFRLLRQHGFHVSQDMFKNFKDDSGNFMACLRDDLKGLVSLYEASYLAFEGEELLEDAKAFSALHLQNYLKQNRDQSLTEQINHALELPLHQRMQRLEARRYIDAYRRREDANALLLQLAVLDFNTVQSLYQEELKAMARWWNSVGLANQLTFVRDRLTECFVWSLGIAFQPQFSDCRKGLTKVSAFITIVDDIYDVYGSLNELELFTDAVERWDVDAVKALPDYMKLCFLALYNTVNEMAYDTLKKHGINVIPHLTKAWADLCKAFLVEAKWYYTKSSPTFECYMDNAWRSASGVVLLAHAYFLMSQHITEEIMECFDQGHDLLKQPSMVFRLCNDLATSSAELERGETANAIMCCMSDTGLSEQHGRQHTRNLIEECWKKMNKALVDAHPFPKSFVGAAIDLARISHCTYQYGDGIGAPDTRAKTRVLQLIIEPIPHTNAYTPTAIPNKTSMNASRKCKQ